MREAGRASVSSSWSRVWPTHRRHGLDRDAFARHVGVQRGVDVLHARAGAHQQDFCTANVDERTGRHAVTGRGGGWEDQCTRCRSNCMLQLALALLQAGAVDLSTLCAAMWQGQQEGRADAPGCGRTMCTGARLRGQTSTMRWTSHNSVKLRKTSTLPRMWMPLTVKPYLSCAWMWLRLSSCSFQGSGAVAAGP